MVLPLLTCIRPVPGSAVKGTPGALLPAPCLQLRGQHGCGCDCKQVRASAVL
jgi:hypothetical protein